MRQHTAVLLVDPPGAEGYLPIAAGYVVAYARADDQLEQSCVFRLDTSHYLDPLERVLERIRAAGLPDVVGLSCQGWSVRRADQVARALRDLAPETLVVYGGNHVSHQGNAFFRDRPFADVLVNGEGEETFREVLLTYVRCESRNALRAELASIDGVSYVSASGTVVTNRPRPRVMDLARLPSPYLSGVLSVDRDVCRTALIETNRGCPYACSYCYWGGAIGQKIAAFPLERVKAELEFLAHRGVEAVYICDANFGILPQDAEIVEFIAQLRARYGFPRTLHTNWAKNSNERIVDLCARLNRGGVHSTYTLAIQTTTENALQLANRQNMKINRIEEISALCRGHGIVPRGELIWGLPGESLDEFFRSYDDLAAHTDALTVYPHYLLPNTGYMTRVDELGIGQRYGEIDTDYRYCTEHRDMTFEDFLEGVRFIISNNILRVGGTFLRLFPRCAQLAAGIPQSRVIREFRSWVEHTQHPVARRFQPYYRFPLATHRASLGEVWSALREDRDALTDMFTAYATDAFIAKASPDVADLLGEALAFDLATYPIMDTAAQEAATPLETYERVHSFTFDLLRVKEGLTFAPERGSFSYKFSAPKGLWRYPVENYYFGLLGYQASVTRVMAGEPSVARSRR